MPISLPWWFLLINLGYNCVHGSVGFYERSLQGCGEAAARGRRLWGRGRVSRGQRRGWQRLDSTRRVVLEPPTRKCPQAGDSGKCQSWQPWLCPEALAPA